MGNKLKEGFFNFNISTIISLATKCITSLIYVFRKKKTFLPNKLARYPIPGYIKDCLMNMSGDIELLIPELAQVSL